MAASGSSGSSKPKSAETIGERIYRLRKERGLSQSSLAEKGMTGAHISRIEAGNRVPSMKVIRRLAPKLGVSVEYLEKGVELTTREELELELGDAELRVRLDPSDETVESDLRALIDRAGRDGQSDLAAKAHAALGMVAAHQGRLEEAARELKEALANPVMRPEVVPDAYTTLAVVYCDLGRPRDAVALCERALMELPGEDRALRMVLATHLGQALSDLGDYQRAERVLGEYAGDPESVNPYSRARVYWSLARVATMQDKRRLALRHMEQAIVLLAGSEDTARLARAHVMCGYILLWGGRTSGVAEHLETARALLPARADVSDHGLLRALEALLAARQSRYDEALKAADEALSLLSDQGLDRAPALYAKALASTDLADYDQADLLYDEVLELLVPIKLWREAAMVAGSRSEELRLAGKGKEAGKMERLAREYGARVSRARVSR
jgi:transcriptional regulator with XRE-family HTH domain